jgi:transposase
LLYALPEQVRSALLACLTKEAGSTLDELPGISTRSAAELLVQAGDPRRFAGEGSFARFNGTAPLAASSAEGDDEPKRYRLDRGGNRHINAVLHRMAVTQLRCDPRAQLLFQSVRKRGHTKAEAMRVLKRHLSNVVYRRMLTDLERKTATSPKPKKGAANVRARAA